MPAEDVLKVVFHWSGYGEEGAVSLWFQSAGSHSDTLLGNAAGNIDTQFGSNATPSLWSNLQDMLTTAQKWDEITVYQYNNLPGTVSNLGRVTVAHTGHVTGTISPLQTSLCAQLHTGTAGASNRGRIYMPGHCLPVSAGNALVTSDNASLVAENVASMIGVTGNALSGTLDAADPLTAVVYSPTKGYVTPITSVIVDNRPDIQRRRANKLEPTSTAVVVSP